MSRAMLELRRTEHYLVHEAIATGGMASVHVGVREGALGFSRVVAVKRLHPQFSADARFVAMLVEEARLASRIRHVNVVPTLDVLEVDGEVFVIMEYMRGASLARLMEKTAERDELVPLRYASAIAAGALRGLDAAHDATDVDGAPLGIVHRDVSPQNILVGAFGIPRVIDFGVARAMGRADPTRSGEFKGKLAYAAPEQLGEGVATRETDVYAMGIVLWELVTGERLFKGATDVETFKRAMRGEVPSPMDVLARDAALGQSRSRPEVEALSDVVMKALAREPSRRFRTAAAMAQAIDDAVPGAAAPEVGRWVQSLASAELEREQEVVSRAEEDFASRSRLARVSRPDLAVGDRTETRRERRPLPELRQPTRHFLIGLPPMTLVAIALSAAAGAGIGVMFFAR